MNVRPGQMWPSEFECSILERMARDITWLRGPFGALHVVSREYTGVGSYTNFACDLPECENDSCPGLNALIRMPGVPDGMGAVLWCRGTSAKCLEIFTYGASTWDGTYAGFEFEELGSG